MSFFSASWAQFGHNFFVGEFETTTRIANRSLKKLLRGPVQSENRLFLMRSRAIRLFVMENHHENSDLFYVAAQHGERPNV